MAPFLLFGGMLADEFNEDPDLWQFQGLFGEHEIGGADQGLAVLEEQRADMPLEII